MFTSIRITNGLILLPTKPKSWKQPLKINYIGIQNWQVTAFVFEHLGDTIFELHINWNKEDEHAIQNGGRKKDLYPNRSTKEKASNVNHLLSRAYF